MVQQGHPPIAGLASSHTNGRLSIYKNEPIAAKHLLKPENGRPGPKSEGTSVGTPRKGSALSSRTQAFSISIVFRLFLFNKSWNPNQLGSYFDCDCSSTSAIELFVCETRRENLKGGKIALV